MNIGIIGSGHIGGTLGKLWVGAGHKVLFSSRHPEDLSGLLTEVGPGAHAGGVAQAAHFGEVILFAVPFPTTDDALALAGPLSGKIVIDATNPYNAGASGLAVPETTTGAEELARKLPGARVVKAFNTLPAQELAGTAHRPNGERVVIFYCGDDDSAKAKVAGLIEACGFLPLDTGPLKDAREQEPSGSLYGKAMMREEAENLLAAL